MSFLSNMKLGKKIVLASASMVVLLVCILGLSFWSMARIRSAQDDARRQAMKASQAQDMRTHISNVMMYLGTVLMHQEGGTKGCNSCHEMKSRATLLAPIEAERAQYTKLVNELRETAADEHEKQLIASVDQAIATVQESNLKVVELWNADKTQDAWTKYKYESVASLPAAMNALQKTVEYAQSQVTESCNASAATVASSRLVLLGVVLFGAILSIPFGMMMARDMARPIASVIQHLDGVGHGDVSKDLPANLTSRKDEAGDLSNATQLLLTNLRPIIREVADGVQTLSASSTELSAVSGQMTNGSKQTSERADAVSSAAEQMSASMQTLTGEMDQATNNLNSVATATEQMTATIGEIAANSEKARRITEDATRQASQVSQSVEQLGDAAQKIGKVTETISNISAQTNLLALNATIEAARAGAAGKGFAVVANEIKDLAQQTASATEDIKDKVLGIQSSTSQTIVDIGSISQTIRDVSEIVSSIATAIEQQAAVTKDIAGNITEASTRVHTASDQVSQSSRVSVQIAEDISSVTAAASEAAAGSTQVSSGAVDLSKLAEALRHTVEQFKL